MIDSTPGMSKRCASCFIKAPRLTAARNNSAVIMALIARANPKANIPIFAGDLINVPSAVDVTIYCLGQFHQPGALTFRSPDRVTLLGVIARAGGLTDRASNKILIKRDGRSGKAEINVDYKKILAGKEPDVELQSGDVIVVKESFF